MRLIDAEQIIYHGEYEDVVYETMIDTLPTVEAEPIRHGCWVKDIGETFCSECHVRIPTVKYTQHFYDDDDGSDYEEYEDEIAETPYCPNCGAKMDSEE